jgi:hypothetical protein
MGGQMGSKRSAILLALLMLGSLPILPASGEQVTHFGNAGSPSTVQIVFAGEGWDSSTNLTLGSNGVVSDASLDVVGSSNQGIRPSTIGIDFGDDGDLEWAFGGPGNGSFGHVDESSEGWGRFALNLTNGSDATHSIRLPLNATVTSASMNFSTLSELTLSGNDVRDSLLHKPNPSWGNVTHAICNYGIYPGINIGKTEWSNWNIYRGAVLFNISQLASATVIDVNLSFYVQSVANNANTGQPVTALHDYNVHPLLKDWVEGLENRAPVNQGPGVTWNHAIDNVTGADYAWSSPGASAATDRGASVVTIRESPANLAQTWMTFNSVALTDLVQGWINGSITNQGMLLTGDENTNKPDASRLTLTDSANASHGPRLVIVFEGTDDVTGGLDVGDDGSVEWSHAGNLSAGSTTPDLTATLNALLAGASPTFTDAWGNEFLDIPLNVTGNATLVIDDLDVRYDWTPTVSTSPNGDLVSELNQHLGTLPADATGNVSIPINVTSGSAGIVELSNLVVNLGDRPPSVGAVDLATETWVPNGDAYTVGMEVTSYQGLSNLSYVAMTPQLSSVTNPPVFVHSLVNGSSWVTDANGFVTNMSGSWQSLNADTGRMDWTVMPSWNWIEEADVTWKAQATTLDSLYSIRFSTAETDHERRMEIDAFQVWDESGGSDGGPQVFAGEWVAGGDNLRVEGTVHFLNLTSTPLPGDVIVELENVSGNSSSDDNGDFSILTSAPPDNHYDGFTLTARLNASLDGAASLNFRIDGTLPGMLLNSPLEARLLPSSTQTVNVTIIDSIELDEGSLQLRWWVESRHDDLDGMPEADEYAATPLVRQGQTDYFHATFDDTTNTHGQQVSFYITGFDIAGNPLSTGPGLVDDLHHYTSLVPSPATLNSTRIGLHADSILVPAHPVWLEIILNEQNGLEDIDRIVVELGATQMTWTNGSMASDDPNLVLMDFTLTEIGDSVVLNITFSLDPIFDGSGTQFLTLRVTDSSGQQTFNPPLFWTFNADVELVDFTISLDDVPLLEDDFVTLGSRLTITGRIRYVAADLAPPPDSIEVQLEVPLDLPLSVTTDSEGGFSGTMDVLGGGLYRATLSVVEGEGMADSIGSQRLQLDDFAPALIGSSPAFIAANSTAVMLQFDIQEIGSGLSGDAIPMTCQAHDGFEAVGESVSADSNLLIAAEVSRYRVNLTFPPLIGVDAVDCWMQVSDRAGNGLSGTGSAPTWALRLDVVETRADLVATEIAFTNDPVFGHDTTIEITLQNLGNHTATPFWVTLEANEDQVASGQIQFLEGQTSTFIRLDWNPDWKGELDLIVHVDTEQQIEERNENNSFTHTIHVDDAPEGSMFNLASLGGIGLLVLLGIVGVLFVAMKLKGRDDSEHWDDDEEFDA